MASKTKVLRPQHVYLEVSIDTDQSLGDPPSSTDLERLIKQSLENLFGNSSTTMPADLLAFDEGNQRAIVRCLSDDSGQIWAALTCIRTCNDRPCALRVSRTSGWLPCLASDDRAWQTEL